MAKRMLLNITAVLAVCVMGVSAQAVITGSAHDFGGNACANCHTPHGAVALPDAPLWNRALSTAVYTMYTSPTFQATRSATPDGPSKLCLSCHDGTLAYNGTTKLTGTKNLGINLSDDHPISITYDTALATLDGALWDPATKVVPGFGTKTIAQVLTPGNKMQCSSCHDVHNSMGLPKLLLVTNTGSALCLTCHNK